MTIGRLLGAMAVWAMGVGSLGCQSVPTHADAAVDLRPADRSSGSDAAAEAAPDAPADHLEALLPADTCSLVGQDCAAGFVCTIQCPEGAAACETDPGGTGMQGDPCGAAAPCARGFQCAAIGAGNPSRCLRHCATSADCTGGADCWDAETTAACGTRGFRICYAP